MQNSSESIDATPSTLKATAKKKSSAAAAAPPWSYEQAVTEVEQIISQIEQGELELAQVFDRFAAAVDRLRQCETFLSRQQQQVDLMIETLMDETEPF